MAKRKVRWSAPRRWDFVVIGETLVPSRVELDGPGLEGAPDLRAVFEVREGVPECTSFELIAKPDGRGIRTADLYAFKIDGLTFNAFMRFGLRMKRDNTGAVLGPDEVDEAGWWKSQGDFAAARGSRKPVTDAELREVAAVYREHVDAEPTAAVERMGYSRRTAARRVQQARAAGFLPATTPGQRKA